VHQLRVRLAPGRTHDLALQCAERLFLAAAVVLDGLRVLALGLLGERADQGLVVDLRQAEALDDGRRGRVAVQKRGEELAGSRLPRDFSAFDELDELREALGGEADRAARTVVVSTLLSFVTLPVMLWILTQLVG